MSHYTRGTVHGRLKTSSGGACKEPSGNWSRRSLPRLLEESLISGRSVAEPNSRGPGIDASRVISGLMKVSECVEWGGERDGVGRTGSLAVGR